MKDGSAAMDPRSAYHTSRLNFSRQRLLQHPALAVPELPPEPVPRAVIRSLFDDLVQREVGVRGVVWERGAGLGGSVWKGGLGENRFVERASVGGEAHVALGDRDVVRGVGKGGVGKEWGGGGREVLKVFDEMRKRATERQAREKIPDSFNIEQVPNDDGGAAASPVVKRVRAKRARGSGKRGGQSTAGASDCCFCPSRELFAGVELESELIGPFVNRLGRANLRVHYDCACWAPQVFADPASGQLRHVYDEYCRGRHLRCVGCGEKGATVGCYVEKCKRVFHFRCLDLAGARKVDKFFVAFCATHDHLADMESYKLMMEASSIADVATARRDSTMGLDTPHSRHTLLRRNETEVIFSRAKRIASHNGATCTNRVVFASRCRAVLSANDTLHVNDRPRAVLESALDVATGRLALMTVAGIGTSTVTVPADGSTPHRARAAIASRDQTGIFLLRNLERAPVWDVDEIRVVKNVSARRTPSKNATPSKPDRRLSPNAKRSRASMSGVHSVGRNGVPVKSVEVNPGEAEMSSAGHSDNGDRDPRQAKRRRRTRTITTSESEGNDEKDMLVDAPLLSVPLPASKRRLEEADAAKEIDVPANAEVSAVEAADVDTDLGCVRSEVNAAAGTDEPKIASVNGAGQTGGAPVPASEWKVRTAWEIFLDEQLPKERTLRPEDPIDVAMCNMARLWSLLSGPERAVYESRSEAARFGSVPTDVVNKDCGRLGEDVTARTAVAASPLGQIIPSPLANNDLRIGAWRTRQVSSGMRNTALVEPIDAGLFCSKSASHIAKRGSVAKPPKSSGSNGLRRPPPFIRSASVSLPSRGPRAATRRVVPDATDWDEVFPTQLGSDFGGSNAKNASRSGKSGSVRSPPSGKSRRQS